MAAIQLVKQFAGGMNLAAFLEDVKTQSAVLYQIQIIGEACSHVSERLRSAHPEVPWRDIVGMRNNLVHEYFGVDLMLVWTTVVDDLPTLENQMDAVLQSL